MAAIATVQSTGRVLFCNRYEGHGLRHCCRFGWPDRCNRCQGGWRSESTANSHPERIARNFSSVQSMRGSGKLPLPPRPGSLIVLLRLTAYRSTIGSRSLSDLAIWSGAGTTTVSPPSLTTFPDACFPVADSVKESNGLLSVCACISGLRDASAGGVRAVGVARCCPEMN